MVGASARQERWLRQHWQFAERPAHSKPLRIEVRFSDAAPADLSAVKSDRLTRLHGVTLTWQQHDQRRWSTGSPHAGVQLRIGNDNTQIEVWTDPNAGTSTSIEPALHLAICEALRSVGFAPLHAAVIAQQNNSIALTGASGAGKSTSVLHAFSRGWQPVSEDFAWLDLETGWVYGWDRVVRIDYAGAAQFRPNWQAEGWRFEPDGKLSIRYEQLAGWRPRKAQLTRMAVLQQAPGCDSAWEAIDQRDAVRVLFECAGIPLCQVNRDNFAAQVASLITRVQISRLILGSTQLPL